MRLSRRIAASERQGQRRPHTPRQSSRALGLAAQGGRSQTARPRPRAWPAEHRRVESVSGENSTSARKRPTLAHSQNTPLKPRTTRSTSGAAKRRAAAGARCPSVTAATRAHKSPTIDTCQASVRLGLVLPLHLGDREHASIADPCSARKRESMNNPHRALCGTLYPRQELRRGVPNRREGARRSMVSDTDCISNCSRQT